MQYTFDCFSESINISFWLKKQKTLSILLHRFHILDALAANRFCELLKYHVLGYRPFQSQAVLVANIDFV